MAHSAVLFRTHRLSPGILSEFGKLSAGREGDTFLLLDNDNLPLGTIDPVHLAANLIQHTHDGVDLPVFLTGQSQFDALHLPRLSHEAKPTPAGIKWFNGDYPAYVFRQAFPQYDFYWMLDYDVFFNGPDYTPFFDHHNAKDADFLAASPRPVAENWQWARHTGWAYKAEERHIAFFPAVRFSAALLDALPPVRRERGTSFLALTDLASAPNSPLFSSGAGRSGEPGTPQAPCRWLNVELFVPTEAKRMGFSLAGLDLLGTYHCGESLDLGEDRIFEKPDGKLYHPVKGDFASRLRRAERRLAELEREAQSLRAQNSVLLEARRKTL